MDKTYIDRLLLEARTLAAYAVATGQFPKNSRIFKEINAVDQAQKRGDIPAIELLIVEMQKVSDEIGVTVEQVMRFDTRVGRLLRKAAALATPYLIGFTTLLLTLYLAFQSSELHKADLALREYQDMVSERLQEKLYLAWKMYQYDDVLNATAPPRAQLDSYNKLVDDAKRVYEKRRAVQELLRDAKHTRYVPEQLEYHGPCQVQALARLINGTSLTAAPSEGCPTPPSKVYNVPEFKTIDCKPGSPRPIPNDRTAKADRKVDVDTYRHDFDCFLMSLQLRDAYDYPMDPLIYATRSKVNLLISWLLPGLYGLLGACVFLMRRMLDVGGPGKNHARMRVVHMLSLLLRVALGGLAGIIIGWFWVPTSLTASSSAISVSSVPFGIAFLAGFSIDSLFALLEGLVKNFDRPKEGDAADASTGTGTGSGTGGQARRGRRAADEHPAQAASPNGQRDAASPSPQPGPVAP